MKKTKIINLSLLGLTLLTAYSSVNLFMEKRDLNTQQKYVFELKDFSNAISSNTLKLFNNKTEKEFMELDGVVTNFSQTSEILNSVNASMMKNDIWRWSNMKPTYSSINNLSNKGEVVSRLASQILTEKKNILSFDKRVKQLQSTVDKNALDLRTLLNKGILNEHADALNKLFNQLVSINPNLVTLDSVTNTTLLNKSKIYDALTDVSRIFSLIEESRFSIQQKNELNQLKVSMLDMTKEIGQMIENERNYLKQKENSAQLLSEIQSYSEQINALLEQELSVNDQSVIYVIVLLVLMSMMLGLAILSNSSKEMTEEELTDLFEYKKIKVHLKKTNDEMVKLLQNDKVNPQIVLEEYKNTAGKETLVGELAKQVNRLSGLYTDLDNQIQLNQEKIKTHLMPIVNKDLALFNRDSAESGRESAQINFSIEQNQKNYAYLAKTNQEQSKTAQTVNYKVLNSKNKLNSMNQNYGDIRKNIQSIAKFLKKTGELSQSILSVHDTNSKLLGQIKLLGINASIEQRSNASGTFTLNELKSLLENLEDSQAKIQNELNGLQLSVQGTMVTMEETVNLVVLNSDIEKELSESMESVQEEINTIQTLNGQMQETLNELIDTSDELARNVHSSSSKSADNINALNNISVKLNKFLGRE